MIATLRIQTPRKDERESLDCFPEFIFRFYENLDINPTITGRMVFFLQERHILSNIKTYKMLMESKVHPHKQEEYLIWFKQLWPQETLVKG